MGAPKLSINYHQIEPEATLQYSELSNLEYEESEEIMRILTISNDIRHFCPLAVSSAFFLVILMSLQPSQNANRINGILPNITENRRLYFEAHPILYLNNKQKMKLRIPIELQQETESS
jgi:DNA mismatch repair protein MutS2